MNGLPPNNPLTIAKESMQMGKESGDRTFRLVALVMMAATGLGVLLQAGQTILRDCFSGRRDASAGEGTHGRSRTYLSVSSPLRSRSDTVPRSPPRNADGEARRAWPGTRRETGQQWTDHSGQPQHNRQR